MSIEKPKENFESNEREDGWVRQEKFPEPKVYLQNMEKLGFTEHAKAYEKVLEIVETVNENNGKALLVGGSIRDFIMGKISKDFDLEIYGLEPEKIKEILQQTNKISEVGQFGILKIYSENNIDIDISIPRADSKTDSENNGFEVKSNPYMSIQNAAKRRDFTMNSLAADPLTGEVYDYFDGIEDIKNRILRVTDEERFKDDPLRSLRAIQFIGRFGLEVDKKSIPIIEEMIPLIKDLPKERIAEEWKKLLLKSDKPSLGLSAGMMLGMFEKLHSEFIDLRKTEQDPKWHPEGDVWIHTLMSIDEAAKIVRRESLDEKKSLTIMLATLCHDLGKPITTENIDSQIKSTGHEQEGVGIAKSFLKNIGLDNLNIQKVINLVANHLVPTTFYVEENIRKRKVKNSAILRLARRLHPATIQELVLLSEADHLGRGSFGPESKEELLLPTDKFPAGDWLLEKARELRVDLSRPAELTRGRDWIQLGFSQGLDIGSLIKLSSDLRDEKNLSREAIFGLVESTKDSKVAIEILKSHLDN